VIEVTSGSLKLAKLSQFAAAETVGTAATAPNITVEHDSTLNPRIMITLPFVTSFCDFLRSLRRRTSPGVVA
jgi:hypothetical protein